VTRYGSAKQFSESTQQCCSLVVHDTTESFRDLTSNIASVLNRCNYCCSD